MRSEVRRVVGVFVMAWFALVALSALGGVGTPELVLIAAVTAFALWRVRRRPQGQGRAE